MWTLLVNQVAWDWLSDISVVNSGMIAVAEYHAVNERTSATLVDTITNQRVENRFNN